MDLISPPRRRPRRRLLPVLLLIAAVLVGGALLTAVVLSLRGGSARQEPEADPHAGQVYINDGFNMVWMTPHEGIPASGLAQEDFRRDTNDDGSVGTVPDSLIREFRTSGGRKVYDGGGVMPDVRIEPQYVSRFTTVLYGKGYLEDFANDYFRRHREGVDVDRSTLPDDEYDRFAEFMQDKEVPYEADTRRALNRIKEAARADLYEESLAAEIEAIEAGIRDDKATNLQTYKREIMETLNGAVILRYSYAEGVTEHTLTEDREVHRAVALLDDGKEYARILHEQDTVRK